MNTITGLNVGGAEIMLLRYLSRVPRDEYLPSIVSLLGRCPLEVKATDMEIGVTSLGMKESKFSITPVFKLRRQAARFQPDILHGWMYHGNIAASVTSLLHRRQPVIWSIHHSLADLAAEKPMTQALVRLLALLSPSVSAISYCSVVSANQHEALGFDPSKRVIIPNGVDCEVFKPDDRAGVRLRRLLRLPETRLLIGTVGRAHPMKNQASLVHALGILLEKGHDVHGLFVGQGHETGEVSKAAKELGIADRITCLGVRDDISEIMPGLDIYALTSSWGETFGLAIGEAMACGVPSVTTDVGDCGSVVGNSDLIVPPRQPQALADVLESLLKAGPAKRRELGERARNRIKEFFSLEAYAVRHLELYANALAGNGSRSRYPA